MNCTNCNQEKQPTEFYSRGKYKHKTCKTCFNFTLIQLCIAKKIIAINHLGNKCCDCNGSFHYSVYDFHHLRDKTIDWSRLKFRSLDSILKELEKCVLLCGNCHRIRHYTQYPAMTLNEAITLMPHPRQKQINTYCIVCNKPIWKYSESQKCRKCFRLNKQQKIAWPPDSELLQMVLDTNCNQVGKKLGVNHKSVKLHLQRRGLM